MARYDYVIIGGGMAADAAVKGIRELDRNGSIALIGLEPDPPYARPPLTKKLWQGKPLDSIWRRTEEAEVDMFLGRRAELLDHRNKIVRDENGNEFTYGKLLLATGGTPRRFPMPDSDIIYFRSLPHYRRLRALADRGSRFAVIGGGFIGSEIAAALTMTDKDVVMLFPEKGICSRIFPTDISKFLNDFYREKGVDVVPGDTMTSVERHGDWLILNTGNGRLISADGIVAGIGIDPNLELAAQAGCRIGNGVEVNEFLQAAPPDIYAAGDIVSFDYPAIGGRHRFEHEDNALSMGRQAGRNMAGAGEAYGHIPFFYSDMFDLGYEAVGELDSRLETVADWQEPYRKGVLYYLDRGKVRGVLLWNVWDQVDAARALIEAAETVRPEELKGRLPA